MVLSPAQCRAARALLQWSQEDLRAEAKVAKKTIADFELGQRQPYERTLDAIRSCLERAGVELIDADEASESGGDGARLLKRKPGRARKKPAKEARNNA